MWWYPIPNGLNVFTTVDLSFLAVSCESHSKKAIWSAFPQRRTRMSAASCFGMLRYILAFMACANSRVVPTKCFSFPTLWNMSSTRWVFTFMIRKTYHPHRRSSGRDPPRGRWRIAAAPREMTPQFVQQGWQVHRKKCVYIEWAWRRWIL